MGVILSNMTDSRLAVDLSDGAGELANKDADTLAEMFRLVVDLQIDLSSGRMDGLLSTMNRSASPMVENFLWQLDLNLCTCLLQASHVS